MTVTTLTTIIMIIVIIIIGLWMRRQIIGWITLGKGITMIAAVEIKIKTNQRKRNVIGSPPCFCKLSRVDIGKYFLRPIDKHFNGNNLL